MAIEQLRSGGWNWYHASRFDEADLKFFEEKFSFHPLDYEDVRGEAPLSKLDAYPKYVFAVFHLPRRDEDAGRVRGSPLYVFLGKDFLVTMTRHAVEPIQQRIARMTKHAGARRTDMAKGSAFLLYRILHDAFRSCMPMSSHYAALVNHLEGELQSNHSEETTAALARARRDILFLRHVVDPQRHMISTLSGLKRPFLPEEVSVYFDDVRDILDTMWLATDNLKNLVDGLFDVNEALLSHRTNRTVTMLTVISAALMAPAVVAGFYGMNVNWLPGIEDPMFVGLLYAVSIVSVILTVYLITRRNNRL